MQPGGAGRDPELLGADAIDHRGEAYALGRASGGYAIWDLRVGGDPIRSFHLTPEGWAAAWRAYRDLETEAGGTGLRPLTVGEVIGAAFRLYFGSFLGFMAVAGVLLVPAAALSLAITLPSLRAVTIDTPSGPVETLTSPTWVSLVNLGVGLLVVYPLLIGAITVMTVRRVAGRRVGVAEAYTPAVRRWVPILLTSLLMWLVLAVVALPGAFVGVVLAAGGLAGVAILVGLLLTVLPVALVGARLAFSVSVSLLERRGPRASLNRSGQLVRGMTWRILGGLLLGGLIAAGVQIALGLPVALLILSRADGPSAGTVAAFSVTSNVAGLLTYPFTAIVGVLLYVDARVRRHDLRLRDLTGSDG